MEDIDLIKKRFELLSPTMTVGMGRLWLACEAIVLGENGKEIVSDATGIDIEMIKVGIKELTKYQPSKNRKYNPTTPKEYQRRPGGGRKPIEIKYPKIKSILEELVKNDTAGNPMNNQKWMRASLNNLSNALKQKGYSVSTATVSRLLKEMGYSLKANKKSIRKSNSPNRDEQFKYIASQRKIFNEAGLPIISVDAKKKELIGNFVNKGKTWRREAEEVNQSDYPSAAICRATPYGIYDVQKNKGFIVVGTSNSTAEFAVDSLLKWWEMEGKKSYHDKKGILILADGGGSNGWKSRTWKKNLQNKFCNQLGLTVSVCHYPTGCSKWNPIEHRLFSQISNNWSGKPLKTLEIMLGYIRGTTTKTGLTVQAFLNEEHYEKGIKVSKKEMEEFMIIPSTTLPDWNYTIHPNN